MQTPLLQSGQARPYRAAPQGLGCISPTSHRIAPTCSNSEQLDTNRLRIVQNRTDSEPSFSNCQYVRHRMLTKERDSEIQRQLASMGWHCITIWECQLKPKVREATLESLSYTLALILPPKSQSKEI